MPLPLPLRAILFLIWLGVMLQSLAVGAQQNKANALLQHLKAEHQRILDELNVKSDQGKVMDLDDPRIPALVKKGWDLAGAWAAEYMDGHPSPSKAELEGIFDGFAPKPQGVKSRYGNFLEYQDYSFEGRAMRIGPFIYLVTARYLAGDFPTGTFMVVAGNANGHFQALWNIKDLAEKHYPQRDEIGRWAYLVGRSYYNGPLDVTEVVPLSLAANGHTRFLIQAYQGADGGTMLAQLSIWDWDGVQANPLLVESYEFGVERVGFRFDGHTIQVKTKEELDVLFSSAPSPEPRAVWTIRVTPAGVRNLGRRFLQPEIRWADELLSKIIKGEDTSTLANAKVVEALKDRIKELQAELQPQAQGQPETQFMWGMLDKCRVIRRGQQGAFVLVIDGERVQFNYVRRHGKPYVTHVRFS